MTIFNEDQIRQAIENFQKTHPVSFAYDISHFDSNENVDEITHFINDLCEKAQKATEIHIIMEMAKQYMNGARPTYDRRQGEWIDTGSGQECNVCHEIQYGHDNFRHFCANCGADMREGRQ